MADSEVKVTVDVEDVEEPGSVTLPWISVVIPTYGSKGVELTRNCLRSLRASHEHLDQLEIFVINDGPDGFDDMVPVAAEYGAIPVQTDERLGFAHACNQGLLRANGQVIFLCNNDIEFIEPCLQIMANAADQMNAGVVGCRLLYPDMTVQHAGVRFVPVPNEELGIPGYWDHFLRGQPALHPDAVTLANVICSGALLGITAWAKQTIGLLDESFGFTCEDIDYNLSVIECGKLPLFCGYTAAIHHEGASRGKTIEEKMAIAPDIAAKEAAALQHLFAKYPDLDWRMFAPEGA
jgi:GT2 family glycosyltransferase